MQNRVGNEGKECPEKIRSKTVEASRRPLSILALERRYRAERLARGIKTRTLKIAGLTPAQAAKFDARCVARQISRTEAVMELIRKDASCGLELAS